MAMLVITRGYIWDLLWVTGASGWWLRTAAWSMGWWYRRAYSVGPAYPSHSACENQKVPGCWKPHTLRLSKDRAKHEASCESYPYVCDILISWDILGWYSKSWLFWMNHRLQVTCLPATIPAIPPQVFEVDEVESHCDEALGLVDGPMIVLSEISFHFRDIPITILHLSRFIQVSKWF